MARVSAAVGFSVEQGGGEPFDRYAFDDQLTQHARLFAFMFSCTNGFPSLTWNPVIIKASQHAGWHTICRNGMQSWTQLTRQAWTRARECVCVCVCVGASSLFLSIISKEHMLLSVWACAWIDISAHTCVCKLSSVTKSLAEMLIFMYVNIFLRKLLVL